LVRDFYGFMEVVQDEQSGLTLQTTVKRVTFRIDVSLIDSFIGTDPVPFEGVPFPDSVDPPSMEELLDFLSSPLSSRQSPSFDQNWLILLSVSSSLKDCATQSMAYSSKG
jgi:hypothetical protein